METEKITSTGARKNIEQNICGSDYVYWIDPKTRIAWKKITKYPIGGGCPCISTVKLSPIRESAYSNIKRIIEEESWLQDG